MNARFLTPLLVSGSLAFAAPTAQALPGFHTPPAGSVEARTYAEGKALALSLLRRAGPTLGRGDARLARAAGAALAAARIAVSTDRRSYATCARGRFSLFVRERVHDRVFVCDDVRPHARAGGADAVAVLAQGFVHEAAHLAGVRDECAAMRFELAVMDRTIGRRSAGSRISYAAQCRDRPAPR
jgi:hypothetical protein